MQIAFRKLTNIMILAVAFTLIIGWGMTMEVQADYPTTESAALAGTVAPAAPCDVAGQGSVARGDKATLSSLDGTIALLDTPASDVQRFPAPAGTPVQIVDGTVVGNGCWYLVELVAQSGQGWVPAETIVAR